MDPESPTQTGVSSLVRDARSTHRVQAPETRRSYQFRRDIPDPLCLACAVLYRPVLRRAAYVSAVIGTILTIINQGDVLLADAVTPLVGAKILLTYAVPYSVSTFSALSANRVKEAVKELGSP